MLLAEYRRLSSPANGWHCFGITRADEVADDAVHEGETPSRRWPHWRDGRLRQASDSLPG